MALSMVRQRFGSVSARFRSMGELVYHQLREDIYDWTLRPGDKLNIETIAVRLEVSTMPVRDAIRRLVADGLAVSAPHRGAWVAPFSIEHIRHTAQVRAWLEAEGIREALPLLRGSALEELEGLHEKYSIEMKAGDWPATAKTNLDFHLAIHYQANNPVLIDTLQDLFARTERVRGLAGQFAVLDTMILLEDHEEILRNIRAGDPEACAEAMKYHVLRGLGRLADFLDTTYGPDLESIDLNHGSEQKG